MPLQPKTPKDLALAPVAAQVDANLQRLRDLEPSGIDQELQLELDRPPFEGTPDERSARVHELALRNVDLHGWETSMHPDATRLKLQGGSVSLELALSASITRYITDGT
jgi:hypothetical protein